MENKLAAAQRISVWHWEVGILVCINYKIQEIVQLLMSVHLYHQSAQYGLTSLAISEQHIFLFKT